MATIDVLIPVYNAVRTVAAAIRSIQVQTFTDLRIIVVDDGSTDGTDKVLAKLAAGDGRIQLITKPNSGIVDSLNAGLALGASQFIARHDADDLADPERLQKQLDWLVSHPSYVAVSSAARNIDARGILIGTTARGAPPDQADSSWVPSLEPYLIHPFLMVQRRAMTAVGGYRYAYHSEDTDLYWRLRRIGRLHNMDDVLGAYRLHDESISSSSVVNGRISALHSQLAAISAQRVDNGLEDLTFPKSRLEACVAVRTMQGMYDLVRLLLTDNEAGYLRIAYAAKLLSLADLRPYRLEVSDGRFIREAYATRGTLSPRNERELRRLYTVIAARLVRGGHLREAAALVPNAMIPEVLARAALSRS